MRSLEDFAEDAPAPVIIAVGGAAIGAAAWVASFGGGWPVLGLCFTLLGFGLLAKRFGAWAWLVLVALGIIAKVSR